MNKNCLSLFIQNAQNKNARDWSYLLFSITAGLDSQNVQKVCISDSTELDYFYSKKGEELNGRR